MIILKRITLISFWTLIITLLSVLTGPYVTEHLSFLSPYGMYALICLLIIQIIVILFMRLHENMRVRYATLIYFLNAENDLLLVQHPYHSVRIPPGGRIGINKLPHDAIELHLFNEAGLKRDEWEFHEVFHRPIEQFTVVDDVTPPYAIQLEHRKQRGGIAKHYAFLYVCKFIKGKERMVTDINEYHPKWFSLNEIQEMRECRPFDDVVQRYKTILKTIELTK
jgi:ADP-ribose pyrophosphatase YjhB (NUDIX family)